jgi:hypothetical protein
MTDVYRPAHLADLVAAVTYKPGWLIYLAVETEDDGSGGLHLFVVSETEDSYNPTKRIRVRHGFLVPPASYNERTWIAWIFECLRKVETHEAGEFYQVDGRRPFAPHHGNGEDPYIVWHVGDLEDTQVRAGSTKGDGS